MLEKADIRRSDDWIYNAVEVTHRLQLSRNRDVTPWYALVVLKAFTWLRERCRFYPVEVVEVVPTAGAIRWADLGGQAPSADAVRPWRAHPGPAHSLCTLRHETLRLSVTESLTRARRSGKSKIRKPARFS
jgi:hypothetical protein